MPVGIVAGPPPGRPLVVDGVAPECPSVPGIRRVNGPPTVGEL